jgi:hypothetical protein
MLQNVLAHDASCINGYKGAMEDGAIVALHIGLGAFSAPAPLWS